MKVRIQKLLADAGVESRRHVEEMVLDRRISVNGELVTALPVLVDPAVDHITIDGEPVDLPAEPEAVQKTYILMNKPSGVYCTNVAQGEQKRAIDLLPPEIDKRLYPVGRLDADSRGLLILTNDGDLTQRLTHPRFGVAKTYTAVVDGYVNPATIDRLAEGVWLADPEKGGFKTGRSFIKVVKRTNLKSVLQITIREGRNRQLRRMLANVGHKVRELTRVKIGPIELGGLKPGGFRYLSKAEIKTLHDAIRAKGPRTADDAPAEKKSSPPPNTPGLKAFTPKPTTATSPKPANARSPRADGRTKRKAHHGKSHAARSKRSRDPRV